MTDYLTLADAAAIHADLIEEGDSLWESLAQNHALVDGNRRIAFAATYTFLAINGVELRASAESDYAFINGRSEAGWFRFEELVKWLRAHTFKA